MRFWDAARFVNWLHNGQGSGDTESGAYINIGNTSTFARQPGAQYWIPSEDEWYKAAYHKNDGVTGNYFDYPTGSDSEPSNLLMGPDPGNNANFTIGNEGFTIGGPYYTTEVGEFENSASPYGTFDQGGNLAEWNETEWTEFPGIRGGWWGHRANDLLASTRYLDPPHVEHFAISFRVASVPEPAQPHVVLMQCPNRFAVLAAQTQAQRIDRPPGITKRQRRCFPLSAGLAPVGITTGQLPASGKERCGAEAMR